MSEKEKLDLHIHTTVSDGTDSPEELLEKVRAAGITLFSITDHDAVSGCERLRPLLRERDPRLISGVEFSCRDREGQYHILGYAYRPGRGAVQELVEKCHALRMRKLERRFEALEERFGVVFPEEERDALRALSNPGKPHLGNLMVKYGYAPSKGTAIRDYINRLSVPEMLIPPEEAIEAILRSGGIPVLAHPAFGSGEQLVRGEEMDQRLRRLCAYGLEGLEAYYSCFTEDICEEMLAFAEKYGLYVTAGSDYHGKNKRIPLGKTGLDPAKPLTGGLLRFLDALDR